MQHRGQSPPGAGVRPAQPPGWGERSWPQRFPLLKHLSCSDGRARMIKNLLQGTALPFSPFGLLLKVSSTIQSLPNILPLQLGGFPSPTLASPGSSPAQTHPQPCSYTGDAAGLDPLPRVAWWHTTSPGGCWSLCHARAKWEDAF